MIFRHQLMSRICHNNIDEQFSTNTDYLNIVFIDVFLLMLLTKPKKKIRKNKQTNNTSAINIY